MRESMVRLEHLNNGTIDTASLIFTGDSSIAIERYYATLRVLEKAFPITESGKSSHFFSLKSGSEPVLCLRIQRY